jgi:hypothetical protein
VTAGSSSATPLATVRTACVSCAGRRGLQQEAARPRAQRLERVLVEVERRDREDAGPRARGEQTARRLDAVHARHPHVHEHDVGMRAQRLLDGVDAVRASATTVRSSSASMIIRSPARNSGSSSATRTLVRLTPAPGGRGSSAKV